MPEVDLYIGGLAFRIEKKRMTTFIVPLIHSRAQWRDTWRNVRKSWLIEISMRLCVRGPFHSDPSLPVPFSEHTRRTRNRECAVCVHRRTQMAYELRGSVHAYTHVRILAAAAEYNSGNSMELGQSCFDARLRRFHLLCRASFSHVLLWLFSRLVSR